jgi:small subunit ribosomal protein S16
MVKIRLRRVGGKRQPSYRLVVADSRAPRGGRFIESIGFYNPRTEPETVKIDEGRALHWLNVGAQPTEAVARLLKNRGTLARFEKLRSGEPLEALVAEAEEVPAVAISPKTRREPPVTVAKPAVEAPETADEAATEPAAAGEEGEA